MMKEENHPHLEQILVSQNFASFLIFFYQKIEQKELEAKKLCDEKTNSSSEEQVTTVTPVYHF